MRANKSPKNYDCIFNGSWDIQQTLTLGLTDPARVPVLQSESSAGLKMHMLDGVNWGQNPNQGLVAPDWESRAKLELRAKLEI